MCDLNDITLNYVENLIQNLRMGSILIPKLVYKNKLTGIREVGRPRERCKD